MTDERSRSMLRRLEIMSPKLVSQIRNDAYELAASMIEHEWNGELGKRVAAAIRKLKEGK